MKSTKPTHPTGQPPRFQPERVERVVRAMRFRVVKDGRVLAGAKDRAEAERLALFLDAEVQP